MLCALACRQASAPRGAAEAKTISRNGITVRLHNSLITFDTRSGRKQLSLPLSTTVAQYLLFDADGLVVVYPEQHHDAATVKRPQSATIFRIDPERAAIVSQCEVASPSSSLGIFIRPSADGRRFLLLAKGRTLVTLRRTADCQVIADLSTGEKLRAAAFASDGGVVTLFRSAGKTAVVRYDTAGRKLWRTEIAVPAGDAFVSASSEGGSALVALNPRSRIDRDWAASWRFFRVTDHVVAEVTDARGCSPAGAFDFWSAPALPAPSRNVALECGSESRSIAFQESSRSATNAH